MEWHRAVQENHKVNILWIQNIHIKGKLLQEIVKNSIVQDGIAWQPRIKGPILKTVIIEIEGVVTISDLKTENNKRI